MFGGSHGHSHDGGDHGHSHGGGNHGHSHGGGGSKPNVGFGDDDDENGQSGLKSAQQKQAMMMQQNMMMMKMMASKMKNEGGGGGGGGDMTNAMMAMNPQMTPQMMEFAKKMFEERQKLMKEYMEQGGQSNPAALQEMMAKAALQQSQALAKLKEAQQSSTETSDMSIGQDLTKSIPSTGDGMMSIPSTGTSLIGVDSSYPKSSPLDELIKKKNDMKKAKDEEEARILDQIAKKEYSQLDAVKATQYGVLERLKELIESNQCDPNKPDSENVYLLHWAAINNRLEIAKYLISLGVKVDVIGGELESTPLNWAARSGHVHMVILLMQNGADPRLFDIEGFSTIHLAVMFAHSNVAAYLLVQGIDPDMMDQNGVSPLMYAAQRVHNRDPAQLLITFNARLNAQDSKGNTPLHYCVAFNNASVMHVLLDKGASLDIVNKKGQTALEFAIERKKIQAANLMRPYSDHDKENLPKFLLPLAKNKVRFLLKIYCN
jgi:ankyrin repeat protein